MSLQEYYGRVEGFIKFANEKFCENPDDEIGVQIGKQVWFPSDGISLGGKMKHVKPRKYLKLVQGKGHHRRVYGFIDEFGNFLKAASWNAPAKHPRGNLNDRSSWESAATRYGFAYLN